MTTDLSNILEDFNDAFSNQRLDDVMQFFADDCEFREMNGNTAKNKPQVRIAIEAIFSGAYGTLTFHKKSMVVDEQNKVVAFAWNCQHDIVPVANMSFVSKLTASVIKLIYGKTFYWEGVDYFIFDEQLKIVSKQTYGRAPLPKFVRGAAPR